MQCYEFKLNKVINTKIIIKNQTSLPVRLPIQMCSKHDRDQPVHAVSRHDQCIVRIT
jgi:hypothetical protein